jgi:ABC-type oligopeptide transport system substrate-binding subunit
MTTIRFPDTQSPGNELYDRFGSKAAEEKGSDNVIGVRSPAVDALIDAKITGKVVSKQSDDYEFVRRVYLDFAGPNGPTALINTGFMTTHDDFMTTFFHLSL